MSPRYQVPSPDQEEYIPDLRKLSFDERYSLRAGPTVNIYDGDVYVMNIPRKLFAAATANALLIDDSSNIRLPPDTGYEAVLTIGCYLLALTTTPDPFRLRNKLDLEADLRILKAARLLYVDSYVTHIRNWYWWKFNNRPIDAADVRVVLKVALGSDDPFVRLVGDKIARLIRDGAPEQVVRLKAYVDGQPYLKSIVDREDTRYSTRIEVKADNARQTAHRGACKSREATQRTHYSAEDEGYASGVVESEKRGGHAEPLGKAQKAGIKWEQKREQEASLGRSLQEKMRLGKNVAVVTHAEARFYERIKGKRCPYKVSG